MAVDFDGVDHDWDGVWAFFGEDGYNDGGDAMLLSRMSMG